MKRKLIQLSPTTTVVSLPKVWTTAQNLKKGDEVNVEMQGNTLLIRTGGVTQHKIAKITMSGAKKRDTHSLSDWFAVSAAYVAGCSQIELLFPDKESATMADKFPQHFPGMITEQISPKHILLKDIGADVIDIDKIAQKIFHLLVSMAEEVSDPLIRKKKDYIINSYFELGLRQLRIQSYDVLVWSGLFYALEQFADMLVYSRSKDLELIKDLQILFLSYNQEKLITFIDKLDQKNPLHQQMQGCAQSIQQVRTQF